MCVCYHSMKRKNINTHFLRGQPTFPGLVLQGHYVGYPYSSICSFLGGPMYGNVRDPMIVSILVLDS